MPMNLGRYARHLLPIGCLLAAGPAMADIEANIGVTSNYLWRGVTQTDDAAAVQGGLDYSHASGLYAGTWISNVDFDEKGYELDLYIGFSGEAGALGYDAGYIHYAYPDHDEIDFGEVYLNLSHGAVSGGVAYTVYTQDDAGGLDDAVYYHLGAETDLPHGFTLGGLVGHYAFDKAGMEDYSHFRISVGKGTAFGDFTLALDQHDMDEGDGAHVSVSLTKSF